LVLRREKYGDKYQYTIDYNVDSIVPILPYRPAPFETPIFPIKVLRKNTTTTHIRTYLYNPPERNTRADVIQINSISPISETKKALSEGVVTPEFHHKYKGRKISFDFYQDYYKVVFRSKVYEAEQIWHPSAPWFLYSEYSKYEDRKQGRTKIKLLRSWLIDHSWL
jgi:hypothetical protein